MAGPSFEFNCPYCPERLFAPADRVGHRVHCPRCLRPSRVPPPEPAEPDPEDVLGGPLVDADTLAEGGRWKAEGGESRTGPPSDPPPTDPAADLILALVRRGRSRPAPAPQRVGWRFAGVVLAGAVAVGLFAALRWLR